MAVLLCTPLCWLTWQLKDIRLYLGNARAAGISDEIADRVVKVWTEMDAALPKADICEMYPYYPRWAAKGVGRNRRAHAPMT